jgi:hypothetical protein
VTDLETIRAHVADQLGDGVVLVSSMVRDHGYCRAIGIRMADGWRHAVVVGNDDTDKEVAARLLLAINARAEHLAG